MQNSFLKITAVVGVVGICCLVFIQIQRGLSSPGEEGENGEVTQSKTDETSDDQDRGVDLGEAVPFGQMEPEFDGSETPSFDLDEPAADGEGTHDGRIIPTSGSGLDFRENDGVNLASDSFETPGSPSAINPAATNNDPFESASKTGSETGPGSVGPSRPNTTPDGAGNLFVPAVDDAGLPAANALNNAAGAQRSPEFNGPDLIGPNGANPVAAGMKKSPFLPDVGDPIPNSAEPFPDTAKPGSGSDPKTTAGPSFDASGRDNPFVENDGPGVAGPSELPGKFPSLDTDRGPESTANSAENNPFKGSPATDPPGLKLPGDSNVAAGRDNPASEKPPVPSIPPGFEVDPFPDPPGKPDAALPPIGAKPRLPVNVKPDFETITIGPKSTPKSTGRGSAETETTPRQLKSDPQAVPLGPGDDEVVEGAETVDSNVFETSQGAKLRIEKAAPVNGVLGQPLIYEFHVKNVGNRIAQKVVVEDRIPTGSKLTGTIPRGELAGTRLLWRFDELKPGAQETIKIRVIPTLEGPIGSVAKVASVAGKATETVVRTPKVVAVPRLVLDVKAPQQVKVGDPVVLQFKLTNRGTGDATGVKIRDLIPKALKHAGGSDLEYEIGTIPAGESREIKLVLTAAQAGEALNRVVVTADGGLTTESQATVEVLGARLAVERTGPAQRFLGQPAVFENKVTNASASPVVGATLVENVAKGMQFVEASDGGQYNSRTHTVSWLIGQLGPKQSRTFKVKLVPRTRGQQTGRLQVFEADGTRAETATNTNNVGFSSLAIQISAADGPIAVGQRAKYQVLVKNRGTAPAQNVRLVVVVPAEAKIISVGDPAKSTLRGNEIHFAPVASVAAQKNVAFEIELQAAAAGDVRLKASVQSDQMKRPLSAEEAILIFPQDQ